MVLSKKSDHRQFVSGKRKAECQAKQKGRRLFQKTTIIPGEISENRTRVVGQRGKAFLSGCEHV